VALARNYKAFHPFERGAVLEALVARPASARALLDEMAAGRIAGSDLSAAQARQIREMGDLDLVERLTAVWGGAREMQRDRQEQAAHWRSRLTPEQLARANRSNGRALFNKICADCHRLFGEGEEAGPDLTGAGRKDLDYLLSNILDPSAMVGKDFQVTVFELADGRVLAGVVLAEAATTITLRTAKEQVVLPASLVETRRKSDQSLMPDGLLQPLNEGQVRDLLAYLMSEVQVPLPPED
jgi:putative heme-binding domain-containing protein